MLYSISRAALFCLDAEHAHELTLTALARLPQAAGLAFGQRLLAPRRVMGLDFPNPVGLAAGLDKNACCIDAWQRLGFGFIEVGTVTPRPQPGNPKPRMFRLPEHEALINRLGFNNEGVDALVKRVRQARQRGVSVPLGINIGKNFDTPNERAHEDYLHALKAVYDLADYITVNISSPNTKGLRDLQASDALADLLRRLDEARKGLADRSGRRVPIAVKIAPDLSEVQIEDFVKVISTSGMDAVIATNTTIARNAVQGHRHGAEAGGLSGGPLTARSTEVIARLARLLDGALPIIGVGGIVSGDDARAKIEAGAQLVQLYTGFIYHGPALVADCVSAIKRV